MTSRTLSSCTRSARTRSARPRSARPRSARPLIADVRRNALDDGPGIRSVVFFKGCNLRCPWCQNPETLSTRAEIQRRPEGCTACGACEAACPAGVARRGDEPEDRRRCTGCEACVAACVAGARRMVGEPTTLEALLSLLLRDRPFYRHSGGGVTLSGGEPALHPRFAGALSARLRQEGVPVLLQTAGLFGWRAFARHLLPHLSAVYFDLKLLDPARHREVVGADNRRILANLHRLARCAAGTDPVSSPAAGTARRGHLAAGYGTPLTSRAATATGADTAAGADAVANAGIELLVRVPLVPGLTDDPDNLGAIAAHVRSLGLGRLALLPYNPLWIHKRRGLGAGRPALPTLPPGHDRWMSDAQLERCRQAVRDAGLAVL